jgi:hypothetical protein
MSGQFSASLSLDELPERIGTTPTLGPRSASAPAEWLGTSDTGTDRRALEAPAPASRRQDGELGGEFDPAVADRQPAVGIIKHTVTRLPIASSVPPTPSSENWVAIDHRHAVAPCDINPAAVGRDRHTKRNVADWDPGRVGRGFDHRHRVVARVGDLDILRGGSLGASASLSPYRWRDGKDCGQRIHAIASIQRRRNSVCTPQKTLPLYPHK